MVRLTRIKWQKTRRRPGSATIGHFIWSIFEKSQNLSKNFDIFLKFRDLKIQKDYIIKIVPSLLITYWHVIMCNNIDQRKFLLKTKNLWWWFIFFFFFDAKATMKIFHERRKFDWFLFSSKITVVWFNYLSLSNWNPTCIFD